MSLCLDQCYTHPPFLQAVDKPPFMQTPSPSEPLDSSGLIMIHVKGALPSVLAWEQLGHYGGYEVHSVEAGLSTALCTFVAHTQQVFVMEGGGGEARSSQAELCRRVIRLYQDIAVSWQLDKSSWEFLLTVLLHHTWKVFTHKDNTLACSLATPLLKVSQPARVLPDGLVHTSLCRHY